MVIAAYCSVLHGLPADFKAKVSAGRLHKPAKVGGTNVLLFPGEGRPAAAVEVDQGAAPPSSSAEGDVMLDSIARALLDQLDPERFPNLTRLKDLGGMFLGGELLVARQVDLPDDELLRELFGFKPTVFAYYLGDAFQA